MVSVSYCCVRNNHKTSGMHTRLQVGKGGSAAHLMLAAGYDGNGSNIRWQVYQTQILQASVHTTFGNMSLPRGGMIIHHSEINWLQIPIVATVHPPPLYVGLHFPRAAPSQCLSSMIEGNNAGPFLQDMRLFGRVTLTWGLPISLAKTFLELPCSLSPLPPCSFLLSCTCQVCTWVWKISPLSQHLPFILPSKLVNSKTKEYKIILFSP